MLTTEMDSQLSAMIHTMESLTSNGELTDIVSMILSLLPEDLRSPEAYTVDTHNTSSSSRTLVPSTFTSLPSTDSHSSIANHDSHIRKSIWKPGLWWSKPKVNKIVINGIKSPQSRK